MNLSPQQIETVVQRVVARLRDVAPTVDDEALPDGVLNIAESVVTKQVLQGRIDSVSSITIPVNAIVTPLATDELKNRGIKVQRRHDAAAQSARATIEHMDDNQNENTTAKAVLEKTIQGKTVMLRTSRPYLLLWKLNQLKDIRAATIETTECVARAKRELDPNVFVVDDHRVNNLQLRSIIQYIEKKEATL